MTTEATKAPAAPTPKYVMLGDLQVQEAGAVVFWNASNACTRPKLATAWVDAGLPGKLLPPDKSPEVALREAVDDSTATRRFRRKAPNGGWVIVEESATADALDWKAGATCTLDRVGRLSVAFPCDALGAPRSDAENALATELHASYDSHLWELDGATITGWLVVLARSLHAVALKDTGGVYFIPREGLDTWRTMAGVVQNVTGSATQEIATVLLQENADKIVAAIISAVEREAGAEAEAMLQELADPSAELGKRALATRSRKLGELRAKVQSYGALLGQSMDSLGARLEQLQAALSAAAVAEE